MEMLRRVLVAACALGSLACADDRVQWQDERRVQGFLAPQSRLTIQPGNVPAAVAAWNPPVAPSGLPVCDGSLSASTARGDTAFAAWWSPRNDSSAALVVARSDDGGLNWRAPVTADSTDRGTAGCRRPRPFLGVDSLSGYVHVVYFMEAPEGPGLFITHSVEEGAMFRAPVPVVHGERASVGAVASRGDTVAVAYENPNTPEPQVWLALSRSTGHIFEHRSAVSPSTVSGTNPAVAVLGGSVAVAWTETRRGGGPGSTAVRIGLIRW